jgi:predicted CoA-binding protein
VRTSRKTKRKKTRERALKKTQAVKTTSINHSVYNDAYLSQILKDVQTIALVGASNKTERPSNKVLKFLLNAGYTVFPINPGLAGKEIAGQKVFENLGDVDHQIDMVDIFRKSDAVLSIVEEAIKISPKPKVLWTQLGVEDETAAKLAEANGMRVVMNRCPKIEYGRLKHELA